MYQHYEKQYQYMISKLLSCFENDIGPYVAKVGEIVEELGKVVGKEPVVLMASICVNQFYQHYTPKEKDMYPSVSMDVKIPLNSIYDHIYIGFDVEQGQPVLSIGLYQLRDIINHDDEITIFNYKFKLSIDKNDKLAFIPLENNYVDKVHGYVKLENQVVRPIDKLIDITDYLKRTMFYL